MCLPQELEKVHPYPVLQLCLVLLPFPITPSSQAQQDPPSPRGREPCLCSYTVLLGMTHLFNEVEGLSGPTPSLKKPTPKSTQ